MLEDAGVKTRAANAAARAALAGLKGADFVGYSSFKSSWVVCESKGTLAIAPDVVDIDRYLANPSMPPEGQSGQQIKTVSYYQKAMRQKSETAGAFPTSLGPVISIAVLTSLGTEGNKRQTVVDYVDPEIDAETAALLVEHQDVLRHLIASTHFEWVGALFHYPGVLWGGVLSELEGFHANGGFEAEMEILQDRSQLRLSFALDPALLPVLASRSLSRLAEYAERRDGRPDGLVAHAEATFDQVQDGASSWHPEGDDIE
jgi:hypothetical protein